MPSPWRAIETGTVLHGTYEVVRPVGAGGMGEVYEARHTRLPGRLAIKVLAGVVGRGGANEFLRFRREAEILSSLRHPNIVQVIDFNHMEDGSPYIVMEFLEGSTLAAGLQRAGRFSPRRTLKIVEQIAAGLGAAHARGIVHRDLKPQNVFLIPLGGKEDDFVKIVDFGISKVRTAVTLTDDAKLLGTPQYMSPEQARSRPDDVDGRTDQFALGSMTHEMLTGRAAFQADNIPAMLLKVTNEDPPPLAEVPAPQGPAIEAVLRKAMAKDKNGRFISILEFADALGAAISGQPAPGRARDAEGPSSMAISDATRRRSDPAAATIRAVPEAQSPPTTGQPKRARGTYLALAVAAVVVVSVALGLTLRGPVRTSAAPPASPRNEAAPPASVPMRPSAPADFPQPPPAATTLAPVPAPAASRGGKVGRRARAERPPGPDIAAPAPKTTKVEEPPSRPREKRGIDRDLDLSKTPRRPIDTDLGPAK